MSNTIQRLGVSARSKLRSRRDARSFERAYENASPSMRSELLAISQHQRIGH